MLKSLRYSLLAALALVAGVQLQAKTVTFDFINNGLKMFDGITAVSSNTSTAGDFTEEKSYTLDGVTITVSPSGGRNANRFWSWDNGAQLRIYGGTIKFSAASDKMTEIKFTQPTKSAKWTTPSASVGTISTDDWTYADGTTEVTFTFSAQCRMNSVAVTLGDGDTPTPTPTEVAEVANIAAFNALAEGTNAKLVLNNAQVLYTFTTTNGNNSTYIKDATGALLLYQSGLTLTANQVVNGKVVLQRSAYNNMPQGTKVSDQTNADSLTITEGSAVVPSEITISQAPSNIANLVSIKNVQIISMVSGKYTNYYAVSGTDTIQVYNKFHLEDANIAELASANITGIVEQYRTAFEICPTIAVESNGGDTPTPTPTEEAKNLPYEVNFISAGQGEFTIEDISNPDSVEVWKHNASIGMVANGYINRKYHDYVGYLISPLINLTNAKSPRVSFEHAGRFFTNLEDEASLWVITPETKDTTKVQINTYFENGKTYVFVNDTTDLSAFVGKNVKIAFKYVGTAADKHCGSWEFKNFKVEDPAASDTTKTDTTATATVTIADINQKTADEAGLTLKLTDAKVVYVNGKTIHVREGNYAVIFYNTALSLPLNATVNGTVQVDYDNYYGIHEVKDNTNTNTDNLTITTSTSTDLDPVAATIAELKNLSHKCDLVKLSGVKITSAVSGNRTNYYAKLDADSVQLYSRSNASLYSAKANDGKIYNITAVFNNIFKNSPEIEPVEITDESGTVTPTDTVKAANIAAFLALAENTQAQLQLTNAEVLYSWTSNNNHNSTFVRDASGALLLYDAGLDLTANQIVNGKVMLNRSQYNQMPQAQAISGSTTKDGLTTTEGSEPVPTEITPAQAANNVANLVLLKDVTIKANGSRYYAFAGNDSVQLYNGFHLSDITLAATADGTTATVKGIVEQYRTTYEVYPIEITTTATGIKEINANEALNNAPVYNLAGQRVSKNYRGVVIINGKKYLNK